MTRRSLGFVSFIALSSIFAMAGSNDDSGIARMSYLEGRVSFQHAGDVDWNAASINMALQPADRIYTGEEGRAEIQFDEGSVLRLAEKTDVEILTLKEEFIQIRVLAGLATLNVHNKVHFEINTAAAAFNTTRQGIYRFLVEENGDTDGIVRKGLLDVANNSVSKRLDAGELIHVTAGDRSTFTLSHYSKRDEWDEWNDRRNADMVAYESRKYLPSNVYSGVRELDRHGRWIVVNDYGPAWVPLYVDSGWSPYWNGRWHHRPSWGWTWTSYEPWGWLPYHYGRWSFNAGVGWHWLPGPSYGFHFWSPGLVRFYQGPNWVSWCPLGPGDYYDANRYFYRPGYGYYLNTLRLTQRRGPEDLFNRNIPGAFRTANRDQFVNESFGRGARSMPIQGAEQPWLRGRMVTTQLGIEPTARSFAPAPDRPAIRPVATNDRPAIVRTEPVTSSATPQRYARITSPSIAPVPPLVRQQERQIGDGTRTYTMDSWGAGSSLTRRPQPSTGGSDASRPSIWNRQPDTFDSGARISGRSTMPAGNDQGSFRSGSRGEFTGGQGTRPGYTPPNRLDVPPVSPGNRYERTVPEPQPRGERPRSEFRLRSEPTDASPNYVPRSSAPRYEPRYSPARPSVPSGGSAGERYYDRGTPAPSMGGGRDFGGSPRSIPQVRQAPPSGGSSSGPSMQRRRN